MQLPIDYRTPYLRLLDICNSSNGWHEYRTQMPSIDSGTDQLWRLLEPLLIGIDTMYHSSGIDHLERRNLCYVQIARVEFIWKRDDVARKDFRGAVLFDNRQQPVIHVSDALLGYGGNGPGLSENILTTLGVPEQMFHEANTSVSSVGYDSVVFSRETIQVDIDPDINLRQDALSLVRSPLGTIKARPYAPVQDTWTWWIG